MRWSTRVFLSLLAAILIPLIVLAAAGVSSVADQLSQASRGGLQGSARALSALVAEALADLRREAELLALDPAVVHGVLKGDWATLARGASPRLLSLTLERVADLVVIVDGQGAPLVRVPAEAPGIPAALAVGAPGGGTLRVLSGVPVLLGSAPVVSDGRPLGTVLVGSRLERLARRLDVGGAPLELVFLAGDAPLYTTLAGNPIGVPWGEVPRTGRLEVRGTSYLARSVARWPDGTLWLLVPDTDLRVARNLLWTWAAGFLVLAGSGTFAATWILTRRVLQPIETLGAGARRVAGGEFGARVLVSRGAEAELGQVAGAFNHMGASLERWRREVERKKRDLEALTAVALTVNRTTDLIPSAEETLEVVRRVAGMDVAALYRVDEGGERLTLVGQRGLTPEAAERVRVQSVQGSQIGKVIRTGRPSVVRGPSGPPGAAFAVPAAEEQGQQTQLALPIVVNGDAWGVMALGARTPREVGAEEMQLLEAVAHQVGVMVERASLFAETREKGQRLESLVGLAQTVTASLDPQAVGEAVSQVVSRLVPDSSFCLWLLEDDQLVLRKESGTAGVSAAGRRTTFAVGEGLAGHVGRTREPLLVERVLEDPRTIEVEWMRQQGHVSFAGIPLLVQTRLVGVLAILTRQPHQFTKEEVELLLSFATQAAIALDNARLYAEASRSAAEHQALLEVGGLIGSTLRVERVLDLIVERARVLLGVEAAGIFKLDPTSGLLAYERGIGLSSEFIRSLRVRAGEGTSGKALRFRAPAWSADLLADSSVVLSEETRALVGREGYRAVLSVPILIKNQASGVLAVYWWEAHTPTFSEIRLLSALAGQAAVALDNARLYAETTRRLQEAQALLEVSEILSSTLDSQRLLKQVTIKTAQVCRVERCTIELWEGDRMIPIMSQFADGRERPDLWAKLMAVPPLGPEQVPAYALAIQTKKPVLIPDVAQTELAPRQWIETSHPTASLVVPLVRQDRVVGVINLDSTGHPGAFEPWQSDLAMTIAGQVALALENSRLYAEIRERLKETQTLLAVAQVLSLKLPTQEAMRQVAREVARTFGADMVGAYFLDAGKEALVPMAGYHVPHELLALFLEARFRIASFPILQEAWETRKSVWSSDAMADPRFDRDFLAAIRPRAVLFSPTLVRGEIVGGLFLVWWQPGRTFAAAELRLIEGVASQVGLGLENADLARQTEEKLRETAMLLSVSRTLSSTLDLYPLLRHFLRQVARTIECDSVGVWLVNPTTGWLEPTVGYRVPPAVLAAVRKVRIDPEETPFYAGAFRSKRVQVSSPVAEDPRLPRGLVQAAPHRTQLCAPIVSKDRVIGAFIAVWWERTREFSERQIALIEAMGSQAGVAVENARLFDDNRRRLEELSVLHELSRAVTGQLDLAALVRAIHQQVGRILDARDMEILLYDEPAGEVRVALRMLDGVEQREPQRDALGEGLMTRVLERRQSIRTDEYRGECQREGVRPIEWALRFPHWLGVPMVAAEQTIGVLILRSDVHPYTAADERLLVNIAGLAALAIRSARLFDERTRAHRELAAAQDQLIRTEKLRALGEMASGVAHDFNNLLASILGRAQLLMRHVEDPKLLGWLQVIERAATDGARTVKRIQEFARIRRDQPFVAVDLNRVVRDALEVTQARWQEEAQSRGVAITVTTHLEAVPPIAGDPAELREVLTNLILNALDAMPDGGTLTLATRASAAAVTLTVSDTGTGIPPEVQPRIFDPFFTTKGTGGTGLGLSITYGIVARHRGQIRVESPQGQGATFVLTFPSSAIEADLPGLGSLQAAAPLRCLVVDDEQPVLDVLGDILATGGHSAVLVTDGATAVERFKAERFDLVLTDLAMPGVNGWQVARAVKDHAPSVPVLLVTGWGVELPAGQLEAHGVDAVLSKPVRLDDVLRAVAVFGPRRATPT